MNIRCISRRTLGIGHSLIVTLTVFVFCADEALSRGGGRRLRWGYRPPAGDALSNNFRFSDPWAAMNGAGIPRRNLAPANLNMGGPSGGRPGSGGSLPGRQTVFTGSARQPSRSNARRPTSAGFSVSSFSATSREPAPTEEVLDPPYYHDDNDDWHHGYWGGGLWGWATWDGQLGAWSFPRWRIGPWYYTSGYGRYENPFVNGDGSLKTYETVIDIEFDNQVDDVSADAASEDEKSTKPVEHPVEKPSTGPESLDEIAGRKTFEAARAAFRNRDYQLALQKTDEALKSLLHDPAVHEFRGLVLFARGDFRQAAAVIYDVLAVSPGWDWTTLSSLYGDSEEYTSHLRALENYRRANPDVAAAAFMVAYHYATCGHYSIAVRHLRNVVRLLPDDNLAPHLLTLLSGADSTQSSESAAATTNAADTIPDAQPASVDASKLIGVWKCSRSPEVRIELALKDDGHFTWKVDEAGHHEEFEGQYRVGRNLLLLSCEEGTFIGVLTVRSLGGTFNFRLLENAPQGPGLDFSN